MLNLLLKYMKKENYYIDNETGLKIRKINFDTEDTSIDIRLTDDFCKQVENLPSIIPKKISKYYLAGSWHRLTHLGKEYSVSNLKGSPFCLFVIHNENIIASVGVVSINGKAYIHLGVGRNYLDRYGDCLISIKNYLKSIGFKEIYYCHPISLPKDNLKLKRFVGYFPSPPQIELWEI